MLHNAWGKFRDLCTILENINHAAFKLTHKSGAKLLSQIKELRVYALVKKGSEQPIDSFTDVQGIFEISEWQLSGQTTVFDLAGWSAYDTRLNVTLCQKLLKYLLF